MSVTEFKTKPAVKASKTISGQSGAALKKALDAAQIEMLPLSALEKSPLNVRTLPYSSDSVRSLAATIERAGLLQNLVVHSLPDDLSGVAAGGRRLAALKLLNDEHRLEPGYRVPVKRVSDELALIASLIENEERTATHPAEQIAAFRSLSGQGKTVAQTADLLGYSTKHVQRMMKLANLAPDLLALLADDTLNVEQCQALCLESDPVRQVEIYQQVKREYCHTPAHLLKRAITDTEISVRSPRFQFVGRTAYEAAGGVVREDLFSAEDGDGTADTTIVERLVAEKLAESAQKIQADEGWSWSVAREDVLRDWGDDRKTWLQLPEPDPQYTSGEQQQLDELYATQEATVTFEDEAAIQVLIDAIEDAAALRAWTPEQRAASGVFVSLDGDELRVQRGVQKILPAENNGSAENGECGAGIITIKTPDPCDGFSAPLVERMSSERTLAVQAALIAQADKAVAMLAWQMCAEVFHYSRAYSHPFTVRLSVGHSTFVSHAPSGKTGAAWVAIEQEKTRLTALLPEGWTQDMSTFFALDGNVLMSLLAFCTACSVNGVQIRESGRTPRSKLDSVEQAVGFRLRDWWQPTAENYLGLLSKKQIAEALTDARLTGAAADVAKMSRADAAAHAEHFLASTEWVPDWMQPPAGKSTSDNPDSLNADVSVNSDTNPADAA